VGALTIVMKNGTINPCDGELTFVGKVLGSLPIDVHLGKLLVFAYVYGCLEECLVISECRQYACKIDIVIDNHSPYGAFPLPQHD